MSYQQDTTHILPMNIRAYVFLHQTNRPDQTTVSLSLIVLHWVKREEWKGRTKYWSSEYAKKRSWMHCFCSSCNWAVSIAACPLWTRAFLQACMPLVNCHEAATGREVHRAVSRFGLYPFTADVHFWCTKPRHSWNHPKSWHCLCCAAAKMMSGAHSEPAVCAQNGGGSTMKPRGKPVSNGLEGVYWSVNVGERLVEVL